MLTTKQNRHSDLLIMKKDKLFINIISFTLSLGLLACTNSRSAPSVSNVNTSTRSTADSQKVVEASTPESTVLPTTNVPTETQPPIKPSFASSDVPSYSGNPYTVINNNSPYFADADLTTNSYEYYSDLDSLGRCGPAVACIGKDLMPTKERESIGMIKPSGWHTVRYNNVDGGYLYNRCHLIGYQLTAENANEKNLITGTRYLNINGMLPFENMVADYIKETNNHVLYRVTPVFDGNDLLASGILMEGESVEDSGSGILFCVFCYNVQPGISIDYSNGESVLDSQQETTTSEESIQPAVTEETQLSSNESAGVYIGNKNSRKFHHDWCSSAKQIKDSNKIKFNSRDDAIASGYEPCKRCNP